jgi:hypothetical protein
MSRVGTLREHDMPDRAMDATAADRVTELASKLRTPLHLS